MTDITQGDPLPLFAAQNPVDESALAPTDQHEPARDLLARLVAGDRPPATVLADARRRRLLAIASAVALTAGVGAAWITSRPATNPLEVACYAQPELTGEVAGIAPHGSNPIEACAEVWRTGAFAGRGPVPRLVACVTPAGTAVVLPAESAALCDRLGLDRLGDAPPTDQPIIALRDRLTEAFLASGCVPPDEAVSRVRAELNAGGLDGWRIDNPGPYPPDRPCASLSFDVAARTITLVPFPVQPPSTTNAGGITS